MPWAPSDVHDQSGKTILITGATSGIGFHTAAFFASKGTRVVMACRNVSKMSDAAKRILARTPDANLVQLQLDLSDQTSIQAFAASFAEANIPHIDVLLLNAGIAGNLSEMLLSPQGIELTFATNYLGHWLLTGLLLPYFRGGAAGRVVAVSSVVHRSVKDVNYSVAIGGSEKGYRGYEAYGGSKLAIQLFVAGLNRRLAEAGSRALAVAVHPGVVSTDLFDSLGKGCFPKLVEKIIDLLFLDAEDGAKALVVACTDPDATSESNYGPKGWLEARGKIHASAKRSKIVADVAKQDELWRVSERVCGCTYSF